MKNNDFEKIKSKKRELLNDYLNVDNASLKSSVWSQYQKINE